MASHPVYGILFNNGSDLWLLINIPPSFPSSTLLVSQSAATGRQRLMSSQSEAVGGESRPLQHQQQQRDDDTDLTLRPVGFSSSSAASSIESVVPDWINQRPDKDNAVVDDNDDAGNDEDEWGDAPLSPGGSLRYDQRGVGLDSVVEEPKEVIQQAPSPYNGKVNTNNHLMLLSPEDLEALRGSYHTDGGVVVGGRLMKRGDKLRRMYWATKLREQAALPARVTKSNYRVPAESNTVRGTFDKRSPRCIANCMRQGLVHPIQCHSLCRKR